MGVRRKYKCKNVSVHAIVGTDVAFLGADIPSPPEEGVSRFVVERTQAGKSGRQNGGELLRTGARSGVRRVNRSARGRGRTACSRDAFQELMITDAPGHIQGPTHGRRPDTLASAQR